MRRRQFDRNGDAAIIGRELTAEIHAQLFRVDAGKPDARGPMLIAVIPFGFDKILDDGERSRRTFVHRPTAFLELAAIDAEARDFVAAEIADPLIGDRVCCFQQSVIHAHLREIFFELVIGPLARLVRAGNHRRAERDRAAVAPLQNDFRAVHAKPRAGGDLPVRGARQRVDAGRIAQCAHGAQIRGNDAARGLDRAAAVVVVVAQRIASLRDRATHCGAETAFAQHAADAQGLVDVAAGRMKVDRQFPVQLVEEADESPGCGVIEGAFDGDPFAAVRAADAALRFGDIEGQRRKSVDRVDRLGVLLVRCGRRQRHHQHQQDRRERCPRNPGNPRHLAPPPTVHIRRFQFYPLKPRRRNRRIGCAGLQTCAVAAGCYIPSPRLPAFVGSE
ncbi:MAG TPA: hypothetical protein VFB45_21230 [Pseudolabrys sp.]|nr:hypothetical protein [Pseudolabrys sp.]